MLLLIKEEASIVLKWRNDFRRRYSRHAMIAPDFLLCVADSSDVAATAFLAKPAFRYMRPPH